MLHSGAHTHTEQWATCTTGDWVLGCAVAAALLGQLRDDAFAPWDLFLSCPSHLGSAFCNQGLALPGWMLLLHSPTMKLQICGQSVTLKMTNSAINVGL